MSIAAFFADDFFAAAVLSGTRVAPTGFPTGLAVRVAAICSL
jgi:hypothetical protein